MNSFKKNNKIQIGVILAVFIVILLLFGSGFFIISRKSKEKGKKGSTGSFFVKGKEAGFSNQELEMLNQFASKSNIEDKSSIFSSQTQLDICIRSIISSMKMSGGGNDHETQNFLTKLYDFRKAIEFNKPSNKHGISNSRQINEGQILKILVGGVGVFKSQVVKNTYQYMTISRPVNTKNTAAFSWEGSKISVYFWKEDDAGYVFDSNVTDEVFSLGISSLKINHSEALFRTQKRSSIRIKLNKPAFLYLAEDRELSYVLETNPGLVCFIDDISDTGCAVIVNGKADSGLRVKIQFSLDNAPVCMTGIVRSTNYNEKKEQSVLRIEAENLPNIMRNRILGEVFGVSPEDDDEDLPFRVLDDEAESISTKKPPTNNYNNSSLPTNSPADDFAGVAFPED